MNYVAFLSYSRADEEFAAKLQKQLEQYVLPQAVRFDARIEKRKPLAPIFRDKADLIQSGSLPERIRTAIAASKYLIVVCSPSSRRSEWVNREVDDFVALNGTSNLILVVHAGVPHAASEGRPLDEECLPLRFVDTRGVLLGDVPLWADMRQPGTQRHTFLSVVCTLLELRSLDVLIRRDEREERKRKLLTVGLGAAAMVAVAAFLGVLHVQRQSGLADLAAVAVSEARTEAYAGRPQQARAILEKAYRQGARGDVARSLELMASWDVVSADDAAGATEPFLESSNGSTTLVLPTGNRVRLTRSVNRLISDPRLAFVAIQTDDDHLQIFSRTTGELLAEKSIEENSSATDTPVIVSESGTLIVSAHVFGVTVKNNQSWLYVVPASGKRIMSINTALPELDGIGLVEIFHTVTSPMALGECRYLAFATPSANNAFGFSGVSERRTPDDFVFYEIVEKGLERVAAPPGIPSLGPGWIGQSSTAFDDPTRGYSTNLNALQGCGAAQDLTSEVVGDSILTVGGGGDLEPASWITRVDEQYRADRYLGQGNCSDSDCWIERVSEDGMPTGENLLFGRAESVAASGLDSETFSLIGWSEIGSHAGTTNDGPVLLSGLLTHGQIGHDDYYCALKDTGPACILFGYIEGMHFSSEPLMTEKYLVVHGPYRDRSNSSPLTDKLVLSLIRLNDFAVASMEYPESLTAPLMSISADGQRLAGILPSGKIAEFSISWPNIELIQEYEVAAIESFSFSRSPDDAESGSPMFMTYTHDNSVFVVKRDGSMSLSSRETMLWQGRYEGIGQIRGGYSLPDHRTVLLSGERGYRLIDTGTGMPASGRFLVQETVAGLAPEVRVDSRSIQIGHYVRQSRDVAAGGSR